MALLQFKEEMKCTPTSLPKWEQLVAPYDSGKYGAARRYPGGRTVLRYYGSFLEAWAVVGVKVAVQRGKGKSLLKHHAGEIIGDCKIIKFHGHDPKQGESQWLCQGKCGHRWVKRVSRLRYGCPACANKNRAQTRMKNTDERYVHIDPELNEIFLSTTLRERPGGITRKLELMGERVGLSATLLYGRAKRLGLVALANDLMKEVRAICPDCRVTVKKNGTQKYACPNCGRSPTANRNRLNRAP